MNESNGNENKGNNYQEELNVDNTGFNDTYYAESYNNNKYNDYEEPKKEIPWKLIGVIAISIVFLILLMYFLFFRGPSNGEKKYTDMVVGLCDNALEYEKKNEGIIDKATPGATTYVSLQKLVDAYLISSEPIKDPRYKKSIFGKEEYKQYIPFSAYIRLAVASNGEVYCEGLVDTTDDEVSPILTLSGSEEMVLAKGTNFTDPGAKAVDDIDGDITSKIVRSGTVDTTKVGTYTITYRITDAAGNSTAIERKIVVKEYNDLGETASANLDSITPQIEIKGRNPYCLKLGEKYVEPGVEAKDNVDGNISSRIAVDNKVTGERTGTFRVTYTVEDNAGNTAIAYRSVEVRTDCSAVVPPSNNTEVNTAPVISLIGASAVSCNKGSSDCVNRGATAWDKEDGDITSKIKANTSEVNINVGGVYTVYYEVTDSKGLKGTAERKVTILDNSVSPNVAHFDGTTPDMRIALGASQSIPTPTAKDSNGSTLQVTTRIEDSSGAVVNSIDFYKTGTYKIVYSARPTNGVLQTTSRLVTIYDNDAPTIVTPDTITITNRTTNCDVTQEDLYNNGVTVSDGTNTIKPTLVITGGDNKACTTNTQGFNIKVYAKDSSGNKSEEKTILIKIGAPQSGEISVSNVDILNCKNINVGDKLQLSATVYPTNAVNKDVIWTSNNETIATVSDGLVTAIGKGMVDIKVKTIDEGKESICTMTIGGAVANVPVESVEIAGCEGGTLNIAKDLSATFTAIIKPITASNNKVTWTSSNTGIATIDASGSLKAVAIGQTTVTVTTEDGNKTKTCTVNVVERTNTDTTAPSKVVVKTNNANSSDPYNASGNWYGGAGKTEIKLTVEATDTESGISKFQVLNAKGEVKAEFNPYTSTPNSGELTWKTDINEEVYIRAVNGAGLSGTQSNKIVLRLDNTGPTTTFSTWIEDPNKWVNTSEYTIKYQATDPMTGVARYEYTYDDVKTKKTEDIKIEGKTTQGELKFLESGAKEYVYVRAVDNLENIGPWTEKPSYLNMDTVAPLAPTISILNNSTSKITVGFGFADGSSARMGGFGKYEYKLSGGESQFIDKENGTFFIAYGDAQYKAAEKELTDVTVKCPNAKDYSKCFATEAGAYYVSQLKNHKVEAWSYDKAGNKSAQSTVKDDLVLLPPLIVTCDKATVEKGGEVKCSLDTKTSYEGVALECFNNATSIKKFTTTASDKSITCKPTVEGTMKVIATKENYGSGEATVTVTVPPTNNNGGTGGGTSGGTTFKITSCPSTVFTGQDVEFTANKEATWSYDINAFYGGNNNSVTKLSVKTASAVAPVPKKIIMTATSASGKQDTCETTIFSDIKWSCTKDSNKILDGTSINDGDSVTCTVTSPSSNITLSCSGAGETKGVDGTTLTCTGKTTDKSSLGFTVKQFYLNNVIQTKTVNFPVLEKVSEFDLLNCVSARYLFKSETSVNLNAKPRGNATFSSITYLSNNAAASVDNAGNVSGNYDGNATITVTGTINGKTTVKECNVQVISRTCSEKVSCAYGYKLGDDGLCHDTSSASAQKTCPSGTSMYYDDGKAAYVCGAVRDPGCPTGYSKSSSQTLGKECVKTSATCGSKTQCISGSKISSDGKTCQSITTGVTMGVPSCPSGYKEESCVMGGTKFACKKTSNDYAAQTCGNDTYYNSKCYAYSSAGVNKYTCSAEYDISGSTCIKREGVAIDKPGVYTCPAGRVYKKDIAGWGCYYPDPTMFSKSCGTVGR